MLVADPAPDALPPGATWADVQEAMIDLGYEYQTCRANHAALSKWAQGK